MIKNLTTTLIISLISLSSASSAVISWVGDGDNDGEWNVGSNWNTGNVPGTLAIDSAVLNGLGGPLTIIRNSSLYAPSNVWDITQRNNTTFILTASFRNVRTWKMGDTGNTALQNTVDIRVGQTNIRDRLIIGDNDGGAGVDSWIMRNTGSFLFTGANEDLVTVDSSGVFHIMGEQASVTIGSVSTGSDFELINSGTLKYTLGSSTVSTIDVVDTLSIGANSRLVIDLIDYTAGANTITLANFGTVSGSFNLANITYNNVPSSINPSIVYDADSMDLVIVAVPEPATVAVCLGFMALGLVLWRRRINQ